MTFDQILPELRLGGKFRYSGWASGTYIFISPGGEIKIRFNDGSSVSWDAISFYLLSSQWEPHTPPREYMDFGAAMKKVAEGKKVSRHVYKYTSIGLVDDAVCFVGSYEDFVPGKTDINATDWYVVSE